MNILITGSGGREHTLAWKIRQSPLLTKLYVAPGNAGTAEIATNVNIPVTDLDAIGRFCAKNNIHMVVVGPEMPLVAGIHDYFLANRNLQEIDVIGPVRSGARLEGSKKFANEFMKHHRIPTAGFLTVTEDNLQEGMEYFETHMPPYVLKADGLAAGKGVLILRDRNQALENLREMLSGKFGQASQTVVLEEFLEGIECSVFVLTDGKSYRVFPEAKDYKRIGEGDTGLNTGGMGAVSPVPFADTDFLYKVEEKIIHPTIAGLREEEIPYQGFLYFGLMNVDGEPYVVEYNVRMGDPEAQVVLPRVKSDLLELLVLAANGKLEEATMEIDERAVCTVVMASGGYPGSYEKGKVIEGIQTDDEYLVFHAGTQKENGKLLTSGGRVLAVSAYGTDMDEALSRCYRGTGEIEFEGKYFRKDIGFDLK